MADAIAGKPKPTTNTSSELLEHIHLQALPSDMRAPQHVYDSLQEATDIAKRNNVKVFKSVDLLKDCAPFYNYSGVGMVGGDSFDGVCNVDGRERIETVGQFGAALHRTNKPQHFFRCVPQWVSHYTRYLPAAAAAGHWSYTAGLAHMDVVLRVAEEARLKKENTGIAVVYDELKRLDYEEKTKSIPTQFNIEVVAPMYDEEFVRRAKMVLEQRIAANSSRSKAAPPTRPPPRTGVNAGRNNGNNNSDQRNIVAEIRDRVHADSVEEGHGRPPLKRTRTDSDRSGKWEGKGRERHWVKRN